MKSLGLDGCSSVVSQSDNWSDYQLDTELLSLKLHWISTNIVLGIHGGRGKLRCRIGEVDLEAEAGGTHPARQHPSMEHNRSEFAASISASYAIVQQRTKHVSESLGMFTKLSSLKLVVAITLKGRQDGLASPINKLLSIVVG